MYPIIAEFGPITIYSYGLFVAIAFIIGIHIAKIEARRKDLRADLIYDLSFYLVIGSLIGARLYYVTFYNPESFTTDAWSIFKVWTGGLAIHGAILGGILSGALFSRSRKISFWKLGDIVAPSIILGQAIGRIGCFLNSCCFGVPTESIFGVRFSEGSLADSAYNGLRVHPTQLYESFLNLIGFFIIWSLRKKIRFDGGLFLIYLMIYNCARVFVSALRGDSLYIWNTDLKIAQIISMTIFMIALTLFIKRKRHA